MGTPNFVIQPLQKIENFAARLVLLAPRHHHSTPLLEEKKMHWLPISERIKYKVVCLWFSAINGSGPARLSELLHFYTPSRTLRSSSDTRMLKIKQYKRKNHGFRTFSCFGPHVELTPFCWFCTGALGQYTHTHTHTDENWYWYYLGRNYCEKRKVSVWF